MLDRSPRRDLNVAATMRVDQQPVDVEVLNMSATGFKARCAVELSADATVMIGVAGMGRRVASVVWAEAPFYGFQFEQPLDSQTLESLRQTTNVVPLPVTTEPSGAVGPSDMADHRSMPLVVGSVLSLSMAVGFTVKAIWDGMVARKRRK
ncbi:PilZ domain-containing protein [Sphingomonas sp. FW199]|uniref:PilZ domain-containing protein n=1 Tax=Sphingomonas sp. FW199 TaxID=3400217 RepID=UPI003CE7202F